MSADGGNESAVSGGVALQAHAIKEQGIPHDLSTVRNADKILVFNQGRLEAQGRHAELMDSCPLYRALVKEVKAS